MNKKSLYIVVPIIITAVVVLAAAVLWQIMGGGRVDMADDHGGGVNLELIWVAPGCFEMGSRLSPEEVEQKYGGDSDGYEDEHPVHDVKISRGFWIGKYPVTQAEYEEIMGENPSYFEGAEHPVELVSWHDAMLFCRKLTERERDAGRLPEGYEYRLPTEAEWEYAARGGQQSEGYIFTGSNNVDEVAWYWRNSGDKRLKGDWKLEKLWDNNTTQPLGRKKPNELGIHDMSGNVAEWCIDWYDRNYYERSPKTDPVNTKWNVARVGRGGDWNSLSRKVRSAARNCFFPEKVASNVGFRVCLAPRLRE